MYRYDTVLNTRGVFDDAGNQRAELIRRRVAYRIRDIQRGRPGFDHLAENFIKKLGIAAPSVFGAELNIRAQGAGICNHLNGSRQHLFSRHLELVTHVNLRGSQEGVDARPGGVADSLPGFVDIIPGCARQTADHRSLRPVMWITDLYRDATNGFKIIC